MAIAVPLPQLSQRVKITPSHADYYRTCALRSETAPPSPSSPAMLQGQRIHRLLQLDADYRASGVVRDPDWMVTRDAMGTPWRDDEEYIARASASIRGARLFFTEQGIAVLRCEVYAQTGDLEVGGAPWLAKWYSGKLDVLGHRPDNGCLVVLDYKTSRARHLPSPLELASLPSSHIYGVLARRLRDQTAKIAAVTTEDVEIIHLLPHSGEWSAVLLDNMDMLSGGAFTDMMALALATATYEPSSGPHCVWCPLRDSGCPAW
jgi:hypothetical protein